MSEPMFCAECGKEIAPGDDFLTVSDNFLQLRYFDCAQDNVFCCDACLKKALSVESMTRAMEDHDDGEPVTMTRADEEHEERPSDAEAHVDTIPDLIAEYKQYVSDDTSYIDCADGDADMAFFRAFPKRLGRAYNALFDDILKAANSPETVSRFETIEKMREALRLVVNCDLAIHAAPFSINGTMVVTGDDCLKHIRRLTDVFEDVKRLVSGISLGDGGVRTDDTKTLDKSPSK